MHKSLDCFGVCDVERQSDRLTPVSADLLYDLLALLDAPRTQRHRKAVGGKLDGGGGSDARRGTGNDRGPARRMWFKARHSGDLHRDRKVSEPADIAGVHADGVGLVDFISADSFEQFGQRYPGFHPGQVRAQAEMRAATET